jgi:hypothetical protein
MIGGKLDQIMLEYNEKMKPVVNIDEEGSEEIDADLIDENMVEE